MPGYDDRLFKGTRGRILALLRRADRTVSELAEALKLAGNTVRVHLATLERDGIVEQSGLRSGARKPHYAYRLSTGAEHLFLKSCDPVLENLLSILSERFAPDELDALLREAGHRMAENYSQEVQGAVPARRISKALEVLRELGGVVELEEQSGSLFIQGYRCPLSFAVVRHPGICIFAETLLSEIINCAVRERCNRTQPPSCAFEIILEADYASSQVKPATVG